MLYRKKPVVVEAVQFVGISDSNNNFSERPDWLIKAIYKDEVIQFFGDTNKLTIQTLEGPIYASVGDYIIKGIQGEIYPCKPVIFQETYEIIQ